MKAYHEQFGASDDFATTEPLEAIDPEAAALKKRPRHRDVRLTTEQAQQAANEALYAAVGWSPVPNWGNNNSLADA